MLGKMNGLGSGRSSDRTSPAEGCPEETQVCRKAKAEAQVRVSGGKAGVRTTGRSHARAQTGPLGLECHSGPPRESEEGGGRGGGAECPSRPCLIHVTQALFNTHFLASHPPTPGGQDHFR